MSSQSYTKWTEQRNKQLTNIEDVYMQLGNALGGTRVVRKQIIEAYVTMLSSQFQAFCRDLHSECVAAFADVVQPREAQDVLRAEFLFGRKLEQGNPNPSNLGNDFNRFGLNLWDKLGKVSKANKARNKLLDEMNHWRNAIAHQDFEKKELDGKKSIRLKTVQHGAEHIIN